MIGPSWRRFGLRLGLLAALWLALTGADTRSWIVGAPVVLLAAAIGIWIPPPRGWRWRLRGILPMLWFFLKQSYLGAFDVAVRALKPRLPITPGFLVYRCGLRNPTARIFFVDLVTLMPGTLGARADEHQIMIHALDTTGDLASALGELERKVAALFGEEPVTHHEVIQ